MKTVMITQIRDRLKTTMEINGSKMAAFFSKGKMESYLVAEILMQNENVSNEIIGLKEFTVKKRQQIDLIFCKNLYIEKGRLTTDQIYIALEFKKWYSFNAIDGFAKEHITAIKSDMRKLKELLEIRPEATTYFVLFLLDPEAMKLPLDIKYNYDHNKKFGFDQQVFDNRINRIQKYLENGLKIEKSNIEHHNMGKYRDINFNLFVVYVEIREEYDIDHIFAN